MLSLKVVVVNTEFSSFKYLENIGLSLLYKDFNNSINFSFCISSNLKLGAIFLISILISIKLLIAFNRALTSSELIFFQLELYIILS